MTIIQKICLLNFLMFQLAFSGERPQIDNRRFKYSKEELLQIRELMEKREMERKLEEIKQQLQQALGKNRFEPQSPDNEQTN